MPISQHKVRSTGMSINKIRRRDSEGLLTTGMKISLGENLESKVEVTYVKSDAEIKISGILKSFNDSGIVIDNQTIPFLDRWEAIVSIEGGNLSYKNPFVSEIFERDKFYGVDSLNHNITGSVLKKLKKQTFGQ